MLKEIQAGLSMEDIADETLMKLIIYPLTFPNNTDKKRALNEAISFAEKIEDRKKQVFALTGLYTFCDKIIDNKDAEKIRRAINMTKVEMIYTKEREEAVEEAVGIVIKEKDKEIKEKDRENRREKEASAIALLKEGDSVEKIVRCLKLPKARVEKLKASLETMTTA